MSPITLLAAAVLCAARIHAENLLPRQSVNILTAVADPTLIPDASGKPFTPTITVTAAITSIATETSFVTVVNNVTIDLTETETDIQTDFVISTGFVTNLVTDTQTEVQTEIITNVRTLPALTEVVTQKVTLPAVTIHETSTVAQPAVTVTATKTVIETATPPTASLCPGGNEEVFEAERGVFIIVCGQSRSTFDLISGGQITDSVYSCATLCDSLTAAGVDCSAGIFEADSSLCFPQGVDDSSSFTPTQGVDTAVLNTTSVAQSLSEVNKKRSSWLF